MQQTAFRFYIINLDIKKNTIHLSIHLCIANLKECLFTWTSKFLGIRTVTFWDGMMPCPWASNEKVNMILVRRFHHVLNLLKDDDIVEILS